MTDKLNFDDNMVHTLRLGKSFDNNGGLAFHSLRYDFKPQSLDLSQTATVEVGQGNSVTVKVPHVAEFEKFYSKFNQPFCEPLKEVIGSSSTHTEYRGNKRPSQKECVLIIDHVTGKFTLEKLNSNIQLKSTRSKATGKQVKESAPAVSNSKPVVNNPPPAKKQKVNNGAATVATAASNHVSNNKAAAAAPAVNNKPPSRSLSDESSDSDSSSDGDSSDSMSHSDPEVNASSTSAAQKTSHSLLNEDLRLSDSDSD